MGVLASWGTEALPDSLAPPETLGAAALIAASPAFFSLQSHGRATTIVPRWQLSIAATCEPSAIVAQLETRQ